MSEITHWYKKWWGILTIVIALLFLVLIGIFAFQVFTYSQQIKKGQTTIFSGQKYDATNDLDYWTGTSSPKVTIVEFADFSCPYCEKSFTTIRTLEAKYKNYIKVIYRDYPLRTDYSIDLAEAARCAGEQGKFWPMHDKLFMNQGASTTPELAALAQQVGVDMDKYNSCFNSKKYETQIQKDISDGNGFGINGTPTWFVNGYKLEGDIPMATWEEIIQKLIK